MIKELQTQIVPLTKELATKHAALPCVKGDRLLKSERIAMLRDRHERGLFHAPVWAVCYCNGKEYRVNGNHSSNFLLSLNGNFPVGMSVVMRQFICDSEGELPVVFDQFDCPWGVRSNLESINVHKSIIDKLENVSRSGALRASEGIAAHVKLTTGVRFTKDDAKQLLSAHPDFIAWAGAGYTTTRRFNKPGVIGAMFATWAVSPAAAQAFWEMVRDLTHPEASNASRTLGEWLKHCELKPVDAYRGVKWDTRAYYCKSIIGWNAYIDGRRTDLKYHPDSDIQTPKNPRR